ncbi:MAG: sigma-54 dependent transcriptional regulator [Candidatus Zixiibacteriota bacterium]
MKVLLADDDAALRKVIQFKLKQRGYQVTAAADGEEALIALRESSYDLLLSDMKMPRLTGLDLLKQARKIQPDLEIIFMTAYAAVSQAVEAVKLGAFDYLTKPFDDDQLFMAIEKAVKYRQLEAENKLLKEQLTGAGRPRPMVGVSLAFKRLVEMINKVAPTDATILITGESGTGKELVARNIHRQSNRAGNEFVAVNCAAIPRELLESELFGHVRGAFTGAVKDKVGKFEQADGGTLLLDEISELSMELQAKLLRAIQERVIEPVGSEKRVEIDVRLLAATNVNLRERVADNRFREDLFYRLNVIPVHVPPLRERREDIALLAKTFLDKFAPGEKISIAEDLMNELRQHPWPGNIRELENLMERMAILRTSDILTHDDLPPDFATASSPAQASVVSADIGSHLTFYEAEKRLIVDALNRFGWNRTKAAAYLKIPRHILIYRMKKFEIRPDRQA